MERFPPPSVLEFSGNVAENWRKFIQRFDLYIEAIEKTEATDKVKNGILLTVAGEEALDVYNTFAFEETDKVIAADGTITDVNKHSAVIRKFSEYCAPRKNETYERYVFRSRVQKHLEPMDKFITDLKNKVKSCGFGTLEDSLVRDQIVLGVGDIKLKERLLRIEKLTLTETERLCLASEAVNSQIKALRSSHVSDNGGKIDRITRSDSGLTKSNRYDRKRAGASGSKSSNNKPYTCRNCGSKHLPRSCPAYQTKCSNCHKYNHFAKCCTNVKVDQVDVEDNQGSKNDIKNDSEDSEDEFLISCLGSTIDGLSRNNSASIEWLTKVSVNNCHISLKVDTGAQINVISHRDLSLLNPRPKMLRRRITLRSYQGQRIPCIGICSLTIHSGNGNIPALFAIVPDKFQSILGLATAMKMGILDIPRDDKFTKHEVIMGCQSEHGRSQVENDNGGKDILVVSKDRKLVSKENLSEINKTSGREDRNGLVSELVSPSSEVNKLVKEDKVGNFCNMESEKNSQSGSRDTLKVRENPYEIKKKSTYFGKEIKKEIVEKYPQIFDGVGTFGKPYKIRLREGYSPVVFPVRYVPYAKKAAMKAELDRMESLGVISKVDVPTEFVNSLVLTPKDNGELRCCLDPRGLNKFIERERYHIKTREEIFAELEGATVFTQLDLRSAFWQIPLEEDSKLLTAFGTAWGRYVYNVLAFGLASASEICQKNVQEELIQALTALAHQDNILLFGKGVEHHDKRLHEFLEQFKTTGATLNLDKCEFRVSRTVFLGEILTSKGIEPDPEKLQAIRDIKPPKNVDELQIILGLVNFFSKFIPNLAEKTQAMRTLLRKNVEWSWDANQLKELNSIKVALSTPPVLSLFDPAKPHKVSSDSSKGGIGSVLLQLEGNEWHPIAYASKSMTVAELDYIQIEKEALALTFGILRFESYLYGLHFQVETDNRPLANIFERGLTHAPHRIQALMLKLQKFDFTVQWVSRKFIKAADALSKISHKALQKGMAIDAHVDSIINNMPVSEKVWRDLKNNTEQDPLLQKVIDALRNGDKLPGKFNDAILEMSVIDGVLFKDKRIVIPSSMQKDMLARIHEGHLGISKCKKRARQSLYWPGMSKAIVDLIKGCDLCMKYQYKNPPQPLTQEHQYKPWHKVATDLFTLGGKEYLLVIDYFSNYPEVMQIKSKNAKAVISGLKAIFSRHGIPVALTSDNVPFTSHEFVEFADHYGFDYSPISPHHSKSNGKAEKGVQIVKRLLKKCFEKGEDPNLAVLNYRNTPMDCGRSPAQLLMNRDLKTRLPTAHLQQKSLDSEVVDKVRKARASQKYNHDKSTRILRPFEQGQVVRIYSLRDKHYSQKGVIMKAHSHNSYNVMTEAGRILRRNREHLKETLEDFEPQDELDIPDLGSTTDNVQDNLFSSHTSENPSQEPDVVDGPSEDLVETCTTGLDDTVTEQTVPLIRPQRQRNRPRRLIEED